jgi:hypothetical protein
MRQGIARAATNVREAHPDEFLHERVGNGRSTGKCSALLVVV